MKRILLGLVMVGGLALMAAPKANAMSETAIPSLCSTAATTYSYAVLISASDPSLVTADGTATLPGALTSGFGVGVITFGLGSATGGAGGAPGCSATGELIYNVGDIQTNPIGNSFGPAYCYAPASAFGTGVPCFDGVNHLFGANLTAGGPDGSFFLTFGAGFNWFDGSVTSGVVPFGFWVNPTLGNSIAVGTSIPGVVNVLDPGNGAPIANILMQKQKAPPAATTFGVAPYLGASAISCQAFGANTTDLVAAGQAAAGTAPPFLGATVAGSAQDTLGSISNWNACQSGGSLSFNGNDDYVFPSTGTNPNNANCAFNFFASECPVLPIPYDNLPSATPFSEFTDGTSNGIAFIGGSDSPCTNFATPGAGYETSGVRWGATDGNSYLIVTGLFDDATGAVPVGGSSYCTEYEQSPVPGSITNLVSGTIVAVQSTKFGYVKVTNTTEADCDIEVSMATVSANGCTLSLESYPGLVVGTPVLADAAGPTPATGVELAQTVCTCGAVTAGVTGSLTVSSESCPLSGVTTKPVLCK